MPIPQLTDEGYLPPGLHSATLDEIATVFGAGMARRALMRTLRTYVDELLRWSFGQALIVDGSFVSHEPEPNDIDLILVLACSDGVGRCICDYPVFIS